MKRFLLPFFILSLVLSSCNKKEEVVTTGDVYDISETSAHCGGSVTKRNRTTIFRRGVVWGTSQNPEIFNNSLGMSDHGHGEGEFVVTISGLLPNTTYYVRAFAEGRRATGGDQLWYGDNVQFKTYGNTILPTFRYNNQTYEFLIDDTYPAIPWGASGQYLGATSTNGNTNTSLIQQTSKTSAANACYTLVANGKSDWYLPSREELYALYYTGSSWGNVKSGYYWASTEYSATQGYGASITNGQYTIASKTTSYPCRCIRKK